MSRLAGRKPPTGRVDRASRAADRLHSAAIHILRRLRQEDRALQVGPARLSALSVLVFGGPRSLGELAAAEQVSAPTMSRVAAGLVRERLAVREADPADARSVRMRATPRGTRILLEGRRRRVARLAEGLRQLPPSELAAVEDAVAALERMLRGPG